MCTWVPYQWRPEGPRSPGTAIARVVSQLTWWWELNTFPLQGHYALLAAELSCQPLILHRSYNGFLSWNSLEILKLCDMVTHARWYKFKLVTICFNNWQHPMNFIIGNIWEWETLQTFSNHIKHTPTIDLEYEDCWSRGVIDSKSIMLTTVVFASKLL